MRYRYWVYRTKDVPKVGLPEELEHFDDLGEATECAKKMATNRGEICVLDSETEKIVLVVSQHQALRDSVVIGVNQFSPRVITLIGDLRYQGNHYRLTKDVAAHQIDHTNQLLIANLREQMRTELVEHALKEAGET
jgi:hypothetical protein